MVRDVFAADMESLAWAYIILAGVMEPCWVIGLKESQGLKNAKWAIATVFFIFASMYLLALGIDMGLPIGTAYAVWTGIGAVGALVAGMLLFEERSSWVKTMFIMLIVAGIAGVQITAGV